MRIAPKKRGKKMNRKQMEYIKKHNEKIEAELQRIAETISGDLMRDEMSIDTEGREWT